VQAVATVQDKHFVMQEEQVVDAAVLNILGA
jgi:hypothetical protein